MAGYNDPVELFHRLFSAESMPLSHRKAMLAHKRSVLDAVLSDAKFLKRGLTKTDIEKLDEYFQGIRETELRLSKDEQWFDRPRPKAPLKQPSGKVIGKDEIKVFYDLIVAALQTDSTVFLLTGNPFLLCYQV